MGKRDPRVDTYIAKAADFAKPILTELREIVHAACPQCEETMKWSSPTFCYKGMLCGMSAFKQHATFGFWKGPLVVEVPSGDNPYRVFGRLTKLSDLPSKKTLTGYIKKAMALNDGGVTIAKAPKAPARPISVPEDLAAALAKNRKAKTAFDGFSPSHKREYLEWITEARRPETRTRRLHTAIAQMAEGKPHNWKYMK
jgi:uncharacterized protein YdeI (YjbR/CyaY-like superfamily)